MRKINTLVVVLSSYCLGLLDNPSYAQNDGQIVYSCPTKNARGRVIEEKVLTLTKTEELKEGINTYSAIISIKKRQIAKATITLTKNTILFSVGDMIFGPLVDGELPEDVLTYNRNEREIRLEKICYRKIK